MAASNAASCVRAGAAWGASARGARSEFLLVRGAWGFVMRLSAIRTQHGYIRPRYRDATGGGRLCSCAQFSAMGCHGQRNRLTAVVGYFVGSGRPVAELRAERRKLSLRGI